MHLQGNSIIATLSYRKVLVNVDTKAFSLNVFIKYLEANASSPLCQNTASQWINVYSKSSAEGFHKQDSKNGEGFC